MTFALRGGSDEENAGDQVQTDVLIAAHRAERDETSMCSRRRRRDVALRREDRREAELPRNVGCHPLRRLFLRARGKLRLPILLPIAAHEVDRHVTQDRKSTSLNSSHVSE